MNTHSYCLRRNIQRIEYVHHNVQYIVLHNIILYTCGQLINAEDSGFP